MQMDPNVAMHSLVELARLIAAVVVVYPEHMDTTHDKTTLRRILLHACTPDRFQWYLNNVRYRSSLPWHLERFMAVGMTRNEQFHARRNAHYRTTVSISKRILTAEVNTWLAAEMAIFLRALTAKLSRRVHRVDMLPFVASTTTICSHTDWLKFVSTARDPWQLTARTSRRVRRKGPSIDQEQVYKVIRGKTVKRVRSNVYSRT